jgi:DNA-binding response OmpR family regulator
MSLPVSSQAATTPHDSSVDPDDGIVLLAVDEPSIGRMLAGVFKRSGVNAHWRGGLATSLEWLREGPPNVTQAFVDCPNAPDEVAAFCRHFLELRPTLRILIAGGAWAQQAAAGLAGCGSALYVPKPYLPTELAWQLRAPAGVRAG